MAGGGTLKAKLIVLCRQGARTEPLNISINSINDIKKRVDVLRKQ